MLLINQICWFRIQIWQFNPKATESCSQKPLVEHAGGPDVVTWQEGLRKTEQCLGFNCCLGFRRKTFQPGLHLQPCTFGSWWIFAVKPRSCVQIGCGIMEYTFWFRCLRWIPEFEYLNVIRLQSCSFSCRQAADNNFIFVLVNAVDSGKSCSAARYLSHPTKEDE